MLDFLLDYCCTILLHELYEQFQFLNVVFLSLQFIIIIRSYPKLETKRKIRNTETKKLLNIKGVLIEGKIK